MTYNRFEYILHLYGKSTFLEIFQCALWNEKYEDCAEIKRVANGKGISLTPYVNEWIESLENRKPLMIYKNYCLEEAMKIAGY